MKNVYLLSFFILSIYTLSAQTAPDIAWQASFGSLSYLVNNIDITSDGGYVVGGSSHDYRIYKLNSLGEVEWDKTVGGDGEEILTVVKQTSDNGYILGGWSESGISGDKSEASVDRDFWVVKLDASGNMEWENTLIALSSDELWSLIQTSDGGYLAGGISNSDIGGDKTGTNFGPPDYWIIKLNSVGEIEWDRSFGGDNSDWLYSIEQTSDNGYILGGNSFSGLTGNKSVKGKGLGDYWILKLDSTGEIQWQKGYGGNNADILKTIKQTSDGGYILGGYSYSGISGVKTEPVEGSSDCWIIKINNSGVIEWQNDIGGASEDNVGTIIQTADGGYILGTSSRSDSTGDKSENGFGYSDYWVVKLNSSGSLLWQKTLGGNNNDYFQAVLQTADDGYIASGTTESGISGNKTVEGGIFWLIKLQSENPPCETPPDGLYADFLTSSTAKLHWSADADAIKYKVQYRKNTILTWTNTSATSNVKNLFSLEANTTYKFRVKSNCGAGVLSDWSSVATFTTLPLREGEFISDEQINIYPNPNSGTFTLDLSEIHTTDKISLSIKNLLGEEVYSEQIVPSSTEYQIQLSQNISNGMYLLELTAGGEIFSEQVVVLK